MKLRLLIFYFILLFFSTNTKLLSKSIDKTKIKFDNIQIGVLDSTLEWKFYSLSLLGNTISLVKSVADSTYCFSKHNNKDFKTTIPPNLDSCIIELQNIFSIIPFDLKNRKNTKERYLNNNQLQAGNVYFYFGYYRFHKKKSQYIYKEIYIDVKKELLPNRILILGTEISNKVLKFQKYPVGA